MPYDAVTLDTNTFFHEGFRFESGLLAQMGQFGQGTTRFILSEIVVREIVKHLTVKTKAARDSLESSYKRAIEFGLVGTDRQALREVVDILPSAKEAARARLDAFMRASGCEVVPADLTPMQDLLSLYFAPSQPFEAAGKKKSEFPDAIALLSLQHWAANNKLRLLAVSNDAGWAGFAEKLKWIDVVDDLGHALQRLQDHTEQATAFVASSFADIHRAPSAGLAPAFKELLANAVGVAEPYGSAEAGYPVEVDGVELVLQNYDFVIEPEDDPFGIVQVGAETVVVQVPLLISASARASLSFDLWDSVDREHIKIGGAHAEVETDLEIDALVTFEGNWSTDTKSVEITRVELVGTPEVDFGYVEPDYSEPEDGVEGTPWRDDLEPSSALTRP